MEGLVSSWAQCLGADAITQIIGEYCVTLKYALMRIVKEGFITGTKVCLFSMHELRFNEL